MKTTEYAAGVTYIALASADVLLLRVDLDAVAVHAAGCGQCGKEEGGELHDDG